MVTPALRAASRCLIRPFIHSSSNFTFSSSDISAISFSLLPSSFISLSLLLGAYQNAPLIFRLNRAGRGLILSCIFAIFRTDQVQNCIIAIFFRPDPFWPYNRIERTNRGHGEIFKIFLKIVPLDTRFFSYFSERVFWMLWNPLPLCTKQYRYE